jgi:hypothetical protein
MKPNFVPQLFVGRYCWLVQQCEAGTRRPLLGEPAVAPIFDVCT